jgi:hypothetical protein
MICSKLCFCRSLLNKVQDWNDCSKGGWSSLVWDFLVLSMYRPNAPFLSLTHSYMSSKEFPVFPILTWVTRNALCIRRQVLLPYCDFYMWSCFRVTFLLVTVTWICIFVSDTHQSMQISYCTPNKKRCLCNFKRIDIGIGKYYLLVYALSISIQYSLVET